MGDVMLFGVLRMPYELAMANDIARRQYWQRGQQAADTITALRAENERLRTYALKAFTVVEFCCGEGFLLERPYYDCDDLLIEGVDLLKVETPEEARAALEKK